MGRIIPLLLVLVVFVVGCAAGAPFEHFPKRNTDGRVGFVENLGTTHVNMWVYDEANRLVEEWYIAPAEESLSPLAVNQLRSPTRVYKILPIGSYRVVYIGYYYTWGVLSGRQRVDLPKREAGIVVSRDPTARYDPADGRHYGWTLRLHGGDRPRDPLLRNVNFSVTCC